MYRQVTIVQPPDPRKVRLDTGRQICVASARARIPARLESRKEIPAQHLRQNTRILCPPKGFDRRHPSRSSGVTVVTRACRLFWYTQFTY
jgi:hypothetical protein